MKKLLPIGARVLPPEFRGQSPLRVATIASLYLATTLAAGCATNSARMEEAAVADSPGALAAWINSLPVEVHGTVLGKTAAETSAAIDHGVAIQPDAASAGGGPSLPSMARVVVYMGGTAAPWRDRYCSPQPEVNLSTPAARRSMALLSELCDGPLPVAQAQVRLPDVNPTTEMVARGVERMKSDLARSLVPPEPDPQRYSN